MNTAPGTAPSTGPSTTPPPTEVLFDDVRTQTDRELQKLKTELGVDEANTKHKEWEKIKEVFTANKETITKITRAELDQLKADLHDENEELSVELKVEGGALMYDEAVADGGSTAPETAPTTTEIPVDLMDEMGQLPLQQVPEAYQKEVKNHIVNNGGFAGIVMRGISNWITEIIKGIKGFFATFGIEDEQEKKDALAQINGFEDAEEERRVTSSVKALKSSPITKGPPLSDILRISHISNEELTQILKDNPELDFSSTKNIEAAFTGKYTHNGNREPMRRYERIFINLTDIHRNLDTSEPYNATNKFKDILAGSQNRDLDVRIPASVIPLPIEGSAGNPTEVAPTTEASPEAQIELRAQAESLDEALEKAQGMPESTPEEINTKTEAVKNAQENVTKFKEDRKNTILREYTSIQERIKEGERELAILTDINSPEPSEIEKRRVVQENLTKLRAVETAMKAKIEEVMTQNGDAWEIKDGVNAEKMVSIETAVLAIENNTASVENQELSEEEKEKQEKMVFDVEKEVINTLYGENNNQIDNPQDIINLEKKIGEVEQYAVTDELKAKITNSKDIIEHAKLKIQAVQAFLLHARWLVKEEGEIPDYDGHEKDFIHVESPGYIDINTIDKGGGNFIDLRTWSDERWDLSGGPKKVAEQLGGIEKFVEIIIANREGLRGNQGLFKPKKGDEKFPILD